VNKRFLVAALTLLPGCPLLTVNADVEDVCLTYADVQVEGSPGVTDLKKSVVFDNLGAVHDLANQNADVRFVSAAVTARTGIADFSFVQSAKVAIASGKPDSTLPQLVLYQCSGDCASRASSLQMPADVQTSAIEYVREDSVLVDLDFTGQLPATAWSMDIDVCLSGHVSYTLEP
jgi:hypothetical protein